MTDLARVCVPELGREIFLRPGTTDKESLDFALTEPFHLPIGGDTPNVVVDMGCYIGVTMAHYEHLWPDAVIVGLELDPHHAELARANTGQRLRVVEGAVGPDGETFAYDSEGDEWGYTLGDSGQHGVVCRGLTQWLDELVDDRVVDLLKLDVEGMEWAILDEPGWESRVNQLVMVLHPRPGEGGLLAKRRALREASRELGRRGFTVIVASKRWAILFARKEG